MKKAAAAPTPAKGRGHSTAAPARRPFAPRFASPGIALAAVVLTLAIVLAILHADSLSLSFANDDYLFLDKVRDASFGSLWLPEHLVSGYYRPLSREFHYWALVRMFGIDPTPARLVNLGLWLGIMTLLFVFVRRVAGARVAAIATGGVAALAAWGSPLAWPAGAQDLWMLLFGLAFLHASSLGRPVFAAFALAAALLCKETAAVLPAIATLQAIVLERRGLAETARRTALPWALVLGWALLHPSIGGRLWNPAATGFTPGPQPPFGWHALRRALAIVNLDAAIQPVHGWPRALAFGVAIAALISGMVAWVTRGAVREERVDTRRGVAFGLSWWVLAWIPAFVPSLGWHSYYGLLGMIGGWIALGFLLASRPSWAIGLVAAIALIRPAATNTHSSDWGTESYERRASIITGLLQNRMRAKHWWFPRHSRIFVANIPGGVGLLSGPGHSPMLRTWYADSTLRVWFFSQYAKRAPHDTLGEDFFFATDSLYRWTEFHNGPETLALTPATTETWVRGANQLAMLFVQNEEWQAARDQFEKLVQADPGYYGNAQNLGVCWMNLGDFERASFWHTRSRAIHDSIGVQMLGVKAE